MERISYEKPNAPCVEITVTLDDSTIIRQYLRVDDSEGGDVNDLLAATVVEAKRELIPLYWTEGVASVTNTFTIYPPHRIHSVTIWPAKPDDS